MIRCGNEALTSAAISISWTDGRAKVVSARAQHLATRRPTTPMFSAQQTEMGSKDFPAIGG